MDGEFLPCFPLATFLIPSSFPFIPGRPSNACYKQREGGGAARAMQVEASEGRGNREMAGKTGE